MKAIELIHKLLDQIDSSGNTDLEIGFTYISSPDIKLKWNENFMFNNHKLQMYFSKTEGKK